jgi:sensor histidine kinase YesM
LFNTLNNLYGLSLTEPQRVSPLLLKLSELLRYSVYDVKEIFVPLQYEVDYIRNYVAFECLRLGERLKLNMEIDPAFDGECKIPPMLLLVFVENAFKHSRSAGDQAIKIDINLHTKGGRIVFLARNSQGMKATAGEHADKHSGFGLDSARKRLSLLYGGKHTLRIDSTQAEYVVQLELDCR